MLKVIQARVTEDNKKMVANSKSHAVSLTAYDRADGNLCLVED